MSQQENDKLKNDFPQKDERGSGNSPETSEGLNRGKDENAGNPENNSFSQPEKAPEHPDKKEREQLEEAMLEENKSTEQRVESEKREKDFSDAQRQDTGKEQEEAPVNTATDPVLNPGQTSAKGEENAAQKEDQEEKPVNTATDPSLDPGTTSEEEKETSSKDSQQKPVNTATDSSLDPKQTSAKEEDQGEKPVNTATDSSLDPGTTSEEEKGTSSKDSGSQQKPVNTATDSSLDPGTASGEKEGATSKDEDVPSKKEDVDSIAHSTVTPGTSEKEDKAGEKTTEKQEAGTATPSEERTGSEDKIAHSTVTPGTPSEEEKEEGQKQEKATPQSATEGSEEEDEEEEEAEAAKKDAKSEFEDSVAGDSEDETAGERHSIEKKDYHAMSKEELVAELEKLVKNEKVQAIKEHVEEIRAEFNAKFDEELEEKKEDFLADGGNIIDFHYSTPLKKQFNSLYFDYKEKRNNYYKQLKQDLNKNLSRRQEIIDELKGLLDVEENINTTYKHFKELQDRWRTAGPIPRDKYNTVWNTYHHHVENFYDFLHLNREFRDLDFKHNLEQKLKVIDRAEELTQEQDTSRAFRELQMLHKMWKEELGPVAKEYREDIWNRFSEATKKIHDLRQSYYDQLDKQYETNLEVKEGIIAKIKNLAETKYTSHSQWQQKIKELEALREEFFKAGKVPREKNEETWSAFKQQVRQFNRNKNAYYKGLKKEQYENLEKKRELIKIADEHKDSDDFKATTPLMKKIQADWKKIGHVPRKDSDKVWKQFKAACNHYFDRMHASSNQENTEEAKAFEQKKEILDNLKSLELEGDKKKDLPKIKAAIEEWKNIGRVPYNKRFIEGKFNKLLDQLFSKLDVDNTKAEMMKYENKLQSLNDEDDDKKLRNEHYFLSKKVDETKAEIRQLENNLQFFSNVDADNPLVKEVHKNIANHKEQLKIWKEKLEKIKSLY